MRHGRDFIPGLIIESYAVHHSRRCDDRGRLWRAHARFMAIQRQKIVKAYEAGRSAARTLLVPLLRSRIILMTTVIHMRIVSLAGFDGASGSSRASGGVC
jgi:hypothetical protein